MGIKREAEISNDKMTILEGEDMNRPLWVQKLSDKQLKEVLEYARDSEAYGVVHSEKVRSIIDTWYSHKVGLERVMAFSVDVWKEAAFRWMNNA